jgi:hypothetical protein
MSWAARSFRDPQLLPEIESLHRSRKTSFPPSGASQPIPDGKPTFHSESDRDAIDHVKIIDGIGTSQQLSEWQDVSVCRLHNQADRFRVRLARLPKS